LIENDPLTLEAMANVLHSKGTGLCWPVAEKAALRSLSRINQT